jgi:uncharacterized protein involved in exopolysaccharide biosynthesis
MSHQTIRRATLVLLSAALLGGLLAAGFSWLQPVRYSSSARLLITQTATPGLDPYTAIKASERVAQSLSELVYTSAFIDNILFRVQNFNANYFPADEIQKRAQWRQTVVTYVTPGSGFLTVTVFHPNRDQAKILVQAAADELADKTPTYFGSSVRVQVVDAAVSPPGIAKPDYPKNIALGALAGLLLGAGWLLVKTAGKPQARA